MDLRATGTGDQRYECKSYHCTCTIGADCKEMFASLNVVDCKFGAPGKLACDVEPKH